MARDEREARLQDLTATSRYQFQTSSATGRRQAEPLAAARRHEDRIRLSNHWAKLVRIARAQPRL